MTPKKVLLHGEALLWGPDDLIDYLARYGPAETWVNNSGWTLVLLGDRNGLHMLCIDTPNDHRWNVGVWTRNGLPFAEWGDLSAGLALYLELKEKKDEVLA